MEKPELDVYDVSTKLAWALDSKDWDIVEGCFKQLLQHKKDLQSYKAQRDKVVLINSEDLMETIMDYEDENYGGFADHHIQIIQKLIDELETKTTIEK